MSDDDRWLSRPIAGHRLRLGTSPLRKQDGGSKVAGVGRKCRPGTRRQGCAAHCGSMLRTGQREEQNPRGWRHRGRCSPWAPGARTPELSAGARLHHSCQGMAWNIPECSSLSSGTGLHPCLTQTSEVSGFQPRWRMWEPRACTRPAVLPALHASLTQFLLPCQLDRRCP